MQDFVSCSFLSQANGSESLAFFCSPGGAEHHTGLYATQRLGHRLSPCAYRLSKIYLIHITTVTNKCFIGLNWGNGIFSFFTPRPGRKGTKKDFWRELLDLFLSYAF